MLADVFRILSICCVIALGLLGVLLAVLVLVLFLPITYRVKGHKNADETALKVRMRWLFGLVRASYDYPKENVFAVKVLCFTIFRFPEQGEKPPDTDGQAQKAGAGSAEGAPSAEKAGAGVTEAADAEKVGAAEAAGSAEGVPDAEKMGAGVTAAAAADGAGSAPSAEKAGGIFAKFKKLKYTIRKMYDKIKEAAENISYYRDLWEREDTQELLRYACARLGRVLQNIRPRRLKAGLVYGAGTPDITGYLYALYGMICPHLGHSVSVTPDFTQAILEGDADIAGHITVFTVAYHMFRLWYDKRLRLLVRRIKSHRAAMAKKQAASAKTVDT